MPEESVEVVWTAIRSATRHAQVPRLDHEGQFVLDAVTYIDAQLLQLMIEDLLKLNMNDGMSHLLNCHSADSPQMSRVTR
jgi:hypothetical protein